MARSLPPAPPCRRRFGGPQRPAEPAPAKPIAADTRSHARTEEIIAIQQVDQGSALAYAYSVLPQASSSISDPCRIRLWALIAWLHLCQYSAGPARQCLRWAKPLPEGFASVPPPLYRMHPCARLRPRTIEKQPAQRCLQTWGADAAIVSNGAEAVSAFQAQPIP